MTYHGRELLLSQSPPYSQRRTFNNGDNRSFPSRLSIPQSLRIECKAEERHFISDYSSSTIHSSLKPIRYTMTDQIKPVQFRSEVIIHNNPETDLHIKRLRVAFHYHDDSPANASLNHRSSPSVRSQSLSMPRPSSRQQYERKDNNSNGKFRPVSSSQSQTLLHQWIDDICANEQLMDNDDIVFFIKNGEFFARI